MMESFLKGNGDNDDNEANRSNSPCWCLIEFSNISDANRTTGILSSSSFSHEGYVMLCYYAILLGFDDLLPQINPIPTKIEMFVGGVKFKIWDPKQNERYRMNQGKSEREGSGLTYIGYDLILNNIPLYPNFGDWSLIRRSSTPRSIHFLNSILDRSRSPDLH